VLSVERAVALLQMVSATGGIRLANAGRKLGLAASTTHRLLSTLESARFVVRSSRGLYVPGPALAAVADDRDREEAELRTTSQPYLEDLAEQTGETAHLVVLRGANVRFIAGAESEMPLRAGLRLGREYPAHCVSAGKAILAALPPDLVLEMYPAEELPVVTPKSCATRTLLILELEEVSERGYAINTGESEIGIHGVGAVIIDVDSRRRGGIAVGGPAARLSDIEFDTMATLIVEAVTAIGAAIGRNAGRGTRT